MMPRFRYALLLFTCLAGAAACSKKDPPPAPLEPSVQREMDLLMAAIQTVQSNYVDQSKVSIDQLITTTLQGMIAPVDEEARAIRINDERLMITPAVRHHRRDDGTLVITLESLNPEGRKNLRRIEAAMRRHNPVMLLIDARGCTGADYESAALIASWLLPAGSIVGTLQHDKSPPAIINTKKKPHMGADARITLLIDGKTEDAAEWLAASLKFHHRAVLVGQSSRGLGLIRNQIPVTDDWALLMTAGKALNPDGAPIYKNPIVPDKPVNPFTTSGEDPFYKAAIEYLLAVDSAGMPAE